MYAVQNSLLEVGKFTFAHFQIMSITEAHSK